MSYWRRRARSADFAALRIISILTGRSRIVTFARDPSLSSRTAALSPFAGKTIIGISDQDSCSSSACSRQLHSVRIQRFVCDEEASGALLQKGTEFLNIFTSAGQGRPLLLKIWQVITASRPVGARTSSRSSSGLRRCCCSLLAFISPLHYLLGFAGEYRNTRQHSPELA